MDGKNKRKEETDSTTGGDSTGVNDSVSRYPTLTLVLSSGGEDVACFNLDKMQDELENLFVSLSKQQDELSKELSNFESLPTETEENVKEMAGGESSIPATENKPLEKTNAVPGNNKKLSYSGSGRARSKPIKCQDLEFSLKSDVPKQQKNETPNRFWSFVDAYCADITTDDIKMLESWIESHNQDFEYQDIPALGVHYSSSWTENDILEEIREGSKSAENPKGVECSSFENSSGAELLDRVKDENLNQFSEHVPLIQKLISSLVQENIIASSDIMAESISENEPPKVTVKEPKPKPKVIEDTLENRLLRDLQESGLLEKIPMNEDDELLQELKQMQALLIPVSKFNLQKKKELLARAKAEMSRQESQKRVQEADAKVMESYRAMSASRSKGKKMSKNELYVIRTMLEEREALIKSFTVED